MNDNYEIILSVLEEYAHEPKLKQAERIAVALKEAPPAAPDAEEDAYVIDKLAKLLAEIAVIVNGPEPPLTSWSYHDLPEKVRALKQAQLSAVPSRQPHGYAYRYRSGLGEGKTVIRFSNGEEINGSKPIEALPYWFGDTPAGNGERGEAFGKTAVPEGWVAVPRKLTAENGAKAEFMGEKFDGETVSWSAVKAVHKAIVAWAERGDAR